jgi:hypothetical protein
MRAPNVLKPTPGKKFSAIYGICKFIIVFTAVSHWNLFWDKCSPHPISLRLILILFSHLQPSFQSWLLPSDPFTIASFCLWSCPSLRPSVTLHNMLAFYGEGLLDPMLTSNTKDAVSSIWNPRMCHATVTRTPPNGSHCPQEINCPALQF